MNENNSYNSEKIFKPTKGEYLFPIGGIVKYYKRARKTQGVYFFEAPVFEKNSLNLVKLVLAHGVELTLLGIGASKLF